MTKVAYETPAITVLGSFEEMTRATTVGTQTDQMFPANTPLVVILQNLS